VSALGGLGEIGKNMMVMEYGGQIMVIDAGMAFPDEQMLGIDVVIPDMTYLAERADRVCGLVLTHGHEDHIGGVPYALDWLRAPVYGTPLTLGLVERRLGESGKSLGDQARPIRAGTSATIGPFEVEFFRVNHSIADAVGLGIKTPVGTIVHTGDFKFDQSPVDGLITDFHKLAELGDAGVLCLLSDSTGAERPGYTPSERVVGEALDHLFREMRGRVIIACFATNVPRMQQVIDVCARHGRRLAVVGRSIENVLAVALELDYLRVPDGLLLDVDHIDRLPADKVAILTTGSQGEPMSALTRMAMADHRKVDIRPNDTVIIAATPIPGNEKLVLRTVDHLLRQGARVIYEPGSGVHVSGHGSREDLKLMLNLIRPRYFIPTHGEYRHLIKHARLAEELGVPSDRIFIGDNGSSFEFTPGSGRVGPRVSAGNVLVDGLGVGDVGNVVLRDRRLLAKDGILIVVIAIARDTGELVSGPDVITRGFVYMRESEALLAEARGCILKALEGLVWQREEGEGADGDVDEGDEAESERDSEAPGAGGDDDGDAADGAAAVAAAGRRDARHSPPQWGAIKSRVKEQLGRLLFERTRRRPMILPIILEV